MKTILKHYIIDTLSLYLISTAISGMFFEKGLTSIFLAGLGILLCSYLVKPIINLLLLPLNLITFGLFKWLSSAITLYLVTLVVPGFKILSFNFPGIVGKWFEIPPVNLSGFLSYIAFSLILTVITSLIYWIIK